MIKIAQNPFDSLMVKVIPSRVEDDVRQERIAKAQNLLMDAEPGSLIKGLGVYLGDRDVEGQPYSVVARSENMFKKDTFMRFSGHKAAFPLVVSFPEALHAVAGMSPVGGFDGAFVRTEAELNRGLASGELAGFWTLPTLDIVTGQGAKKEEIFPGNFVKFNSEEGNPLYGTFDPVSRRKPDSGRVWTLTSLNDASGVLAGGEFTAVVKVSQPAEVSFAPTDKEESPSRACIRPCLALPSAKVLAL